MVEIVSNIDSGPKEIREKEGIRSMVAGISLYAFGELIKPQDRNVTEDVFWFKVRKPLSVGLRVLGAAAFLGGTAHATGTWWTKYI